MTSVFLSYSRSDDEPFVERLYHALKANGWDVWWDRVSMPSRLLTFHQEIRDAVATCDRVVLVLGPGAVGSDYVRQEWQFALEEDKVVTPVLRLGDYPQVPDELKLFHAEDFRDEARFDVHLANLTRQLSEPPPPLGKLIGVPSLPAHHVARADRLLALRDAVRADLDRPVVVGRSSARLGLQGMGGIGKSVLAAALARDRKVREAFPDGIVWIGLGSQPDVVILQRRVHRDLGGDGAFETEHQGKARLKEWLEKKAVLLILDDAWQRADVDWFDVLGPRCRALITSRDAGLLAALGGVPQGIELLTDQEARAVLALAAGVPAETLPGEAASLIAECGRLPLAIALCGGMVRRGLAWSGVLQQLRQARIDRIADRHAVEAHHQSVWHAIHASVEFLSAEDRQRFFELVVFPLDESTPEAAVATLWGHTGQFDDWAARELLVTLGERSLVQLQTRAPAVGQPPSQFVSLHDLVHDYARRAVADARALEDQCLAAYRARCRGGWPGGPNDGYFFTHLRRHLIGAGRVHELVDLLQELRWLEVKNEAGLTFDLTADYRDALAVLPADDPRRRVLRLLDEALRHDIHFISRHARDYPQALFQSLWNSGWWYDCPAAARHYDPPPGGWGSAGAPWDRPGPKLFQLLETWRGQKERATPGFRWIESLRPPVGALESGQVACLRHDEEVRDACLSPDGKRIATAAGAVRIWDADSGTEVTCLRGKLSVQSVCFSPDNRWLAAGALDGSVCLWEPATGAGTATPPPPTGRSTG